MNNEFAAYSSYFMDKIDLPSEARNELLNAVSQIINNEEMYGVFLKTKARFMDNNLGIKEALARIGTYGGKESGISEYTLYFIFLINCTDMLMEKYRRNHISELIFWDSMDDFRCKLLECQEVKGVWGTFVPTWYEGFLKMERFALGRFQYEEIEYNGIDYRKNSIEINRGDKVYNFHIPASGKSFKKSTRMDSYRKAYDFYRCKEKGKNLILICNSWLLYKEHEYILPKHSNILDFMRDFDIISSESREVFNDSWRIFGKYHDLPISQLPVDTSLRKAIVTHLADGGKMGSGIGIIVFDGEKIING